MNDFGISKAYIFYILKFLLLPYNNKAKMLFIAKIDPKIEKFNFMILLK